MSLWILGGDGDGDGAFADSWSDTIEALADRRMSCLSSYSTRFSGLTRRKLLYIVEYELTILPFETQPHALFPANLC